MVYTVIELARLAGVSKRTLHYYDEIGLLKPSFLKENGYRFYAEKELLKLQQILFFRELEFPLDEIARIINAGSFDTLEALAEQRKLLELKRSRLDNLMETIDQTIEKLKGADKMSNKELFTAFTDADYERHREEAKNRWGNTKQYRQSLERTKHWTEEDHKAAREKVTQFNRELAKVMDFGVESPEAQAMMQKHYESVNSYYDCSLAMFKDLGEMYVNNPPFWNTYENVRPGLAVFMRDAMAYYVAQHTK